MQHSNTTSHIETVCQFAITYGGVSSAITGNLGRDIICIAPGLCLNSFNFGLIEHAFPPNGFVGTPEEYGLIGFASMTNGCNPSCVDELLTTLSASAKLLPLFGMCLTPTDGGIMDFGEILPSRFSGQLQYTPVTGFRWWNVALLDILIAIPRTSTSSPNTGVASTSIGAPVVAYATTNDGIGSFVDSGTSVILLSPIVMQYFALTYQQYWGHLPGVMPDGQGQSLLTGACFAASDLAPISSYPELYFQFPLESKSHGSVFDAAVSPSAYLMDVGGQICMGVSSAIGVGAVLGDVFMTGQYIVFDQQNMRLGFAPVVACA